ncbi:hypothetical protein AVEN_88719-1 [Araneus ventricosus]|uniref:Uncharacterized protein n=1 Tax=Araneus ventricosus TaxID=182803 RepID=A0A4Y2BDA8_ARAVE|nr:hypothetical protein AVEN_88719-1 [Araneus ventricosus]
MTPSLDLLQQTWLGYQPIDTPGTEMYHPSNGSHARPTRGGNLLSMRSRKQTERQQLLMESSLVYPRGKEENSKKTQGEEKTEGDKTLGYLGVVNPVTSKEDVPLRGSQLRFRLQF